jgi:hypothetical protein
MKDVLTVISMAGIFFILVEMFCYIILFYYLTEHNKNIAANILQPSVIKHRNKTNAISMLGLFACWLLEVWYMILVGILAIQFEMDELKEVSATLKDFDFVWIPLLQIMTSASLRKEIIYQPKTD